MRFIGRQQELERLNQFREKRSASLIVICGRRRIGKSRLIEEFATGFPRSFIFSGLPPEEKISAQKQREIFATQMRQQLIPRLGEDEWSDLFFDLAVHCKEGPVLIAFDEITWMGSKDPTFLGKIKVAWDLHFKKNPQLILILSGSDSTWINRNILESTGFVGRISYRMKLEELPIHSCAQFFRSVKSGESAFEIFKSLSVIGGIPRYLEEIHPHLKAEENILRLCFDSGGLLFNEFEQTFSSLFSRRYQTYKEIMIALDRGAYTLADIAEQLGRQVGGDLGTYLDDLCESGFVLKQHLWSIRSGKPLRKVYYRVKDLYTRFYLRFIDPFREQLSQKRDPALPVAWKSILGLQFEALIINHSRELYPFLRLDEQDVIASGPYIQKASSKSPGCQIDCLIQSKFDTLYLLEVKFSKKEIGPSVIKEVQEKVEKLSRPKGYSIRPVLIHVNGVSDELLAQDYFAHIIDFSLLLQKA